MSKVDNADALKNAMNSGESTIEIVGDLAKKVIRIKATGKVAWAIAFAAIGLATLAIITALPAAVATGGAAAPIEGVVAGFAFAPAVAAIGFDVAVMAVGLAVAAGGVGILTRLRSDYRIAEQAPERVLLIKK